MVQGFNARNFRGNLSPVEAEGMIRLRQGYTAKRGEWETGNTGKQGLHSLSKIF